MKGMSAKQWNHRIRGMAHLLILGLLLVGGTGPVGSLFASGIHRWTFESLKEQAAWIGRVRFEQVQVKQDAEGRIFTEVRAKVLDTWKGEGSGADRVIHQGGGVLGQRAQGNAFRTDFVPGQEAVVFLIRHPEGHDLLLGMGLGCFHLQPGTSSETQVQWHPLWSPPLAPASVQRQGLTSSAAPVQHPTRLSEFRQSVQANR